MMMKMVMLMMKNYQILVQAVATDSKGEPRKLNPAQLESIRQTGQFQVKIPKIQIQLKKPWLSVYHPMRRKRQSETISMKLIPQDGRHCSSFKSITFCNILSQTILSCSIIGTFWVKLSSRAVYLNYLMWQVDAMIRSWRAQSLKASLSILQLMPYWTKYICSYWHNFVKIIFRGE